LTPFWSLSAGDFPGEDLIMRPIESDKRVSAEARESPEMDEPWGNGASFHHMDTRYGGAIGVAFRWLAL